MATVETTVAASADSVFDIGDRVVRLLKEARQGAGNGAIPESASRRLADSLEALRSCLIQKSERDLRSLFDLDERLIELMNCAEEAAEDGEIPQELLQEINDYLQAFRTKVNRIAGYCRWHESIATICGEEAERLFTRKRAAERRVNLDGLIYGYAMNQLGFRTNVETLIRYDVLVKPKSPAFQQIYFNKSPQDYGRLARWSQQVLQAIDRESFFPNFGWACHNCQFRSHCWSM